MSGPATELNGPVLAPVEPRADESFHGLLVRTCAANDYDTPRWLIDKAGGPRGTGQPWSSEGVGALARLLGVPVVKLAARAPPPNGALAPFLGSAIARHHGEWTRRKVCPRCLEEFGHHSVAFDLAAVQACPRHALRLLVRCPGCERPLRHVGSSVLACSCGADLRRASVRALDPARLAGTAAIARRAGFPAVHPSAGAPAPAFEAAFGGLALGHVIDLLCSLGAYATSRPGRRRWLGTLLRDRDSVPALVEAGWDLVRDWPVGFEDFLDRLALEGGGRSGVGPRRVFASLFPQLEARDDGGWGAVRVAFAAYVGARWDGLMMPVRRNSRMMNPAAPPPTRFVNPIEVRRRVGVATARLLAEAGVLPTVQVGPGQGAGRVGRAFVDRAAFEALCPPDDPPRGLKAAARLLGLSVLLTRRLAEEGELTCLRVTRPGRGRRFLFAGPQLRVFAQELLGATDQHVTGGVTVSLSDLLKRQLTRKMPLKDVLDRVRTGRITTTLRAAEEGLGALRLNKASVEDAFEDLLDAHAAVVTRQACQRRLGVDKLTVAWLAREGHLLEVSGGGLSRPITAASLDAFVARWVKAGEVADRHGTSRTLARRALLHLRVKMIGPVSANHGPVTPFFDREDATGADVAGMVREVAFHKGKTSSEYSQGLRQRNRERAAKGRAVL